MRNRWMLIAAALTGASGVLLGAFGAHGLARFAPDANLANWRTAVLYHLLHAVVLLVLALVNRLVTAQASIAPATGTMRSAHTLVIRSSTLQLSALAFVLGVLLFSGSLYLLVLNPTAFGSWLGPVTPLGGVLLVCGWLLLLRR